MSNIYFVAGSGAWSAAAGGIPSGRLAFVVDGAVGSLLSVRPLGVGESADGFLLSEMEPVRRGELIPGVALLEGQADEDMSRGDHLKIKATPSPNGRLVKGGPGDKFVALEASAAGKSVKMLMRS